MDMKTNNKFSLHIFIILNLIIIAISGAILFAVLSNDNENIYNKNIDKAVEVVAYTDETDKSYGNL